MISVIIPVLNESRTIGAVVEFARGDPRVAEVIVVDDGSTDGTPDLARAAGASVMTSTLLGKGASMEDGVRAARNEILLYLDGDLSGLAHDLVERMTYPIREGTADFVKARFSRAAGRVTALTARPLLRTFFPELAHFEQPLGGIVAARRSLLRQIRFENDYGVDVGLFLDAATSGARLAEVDVGHVEHDSRPLASLGDMAAQVARTVLDRAARAGRLRLTHIRDAEEADRQSQAELFSFLQQAGKFNPAASPPRLALFDMDGTLLNGRFIVALAERTGRVGALGEYLDRPMDADERSRRIAALFRGVPREVFEQTAREIPLMPGATETVVELRKAGYRVGIVTDSFRVAAEVVRRRVFADFSVAHLMKFRGGKATGVLNLSPAMIHPHGCPQHGHCKLNTLLHLLDRMGLGPGDVLAVGDGDNDVCMLRAAGRSVAFRPRNPRVQAAAQHHIQGDLSEVLEVIDEAMRAVPA